MVRAVFRAKVTGKPKPGDVLTAWEAPGRTIFPKIGPKPD
jgi:hypothetical protein